MLCSELCMTARDFPMVLSVCEVLVSISLATVDLWSCSGGGLPSLDMSQAYAHYGVAHRRIRSVSVRKTDSFAENLQATGRMPAPENRLQLVRRSRFTSGT
jgi:hypothetical protein